MSVVSKVTHSYTELSALVRERGLLGRTRWFYLLLAVVLVLALAGVVSGVVLLGDSWFQLLMAAALGLVFTQFAFLGHEASHRQVLVSGRGNDRVGRVLAALVGISYAWWMNKHTRHHGNPNKIGADPDIDSEGIAFVEESAASRTGLSAWLTRRQGYLFFPLLLVFGLVLHYNSVRALVGPRPVKGRALELTLLAVRFVVYLTLLFWWLPLGMAFAFVGVQLAVFGVYMGASFAPNHVGMPIVERTARLDFLDKQVRTSRNVTGGWWATVLMGGLNYQIEHHLFPSMPRAHLAEARTLVRNRCAELDVPYVETSLPAAWLIVCRYLNRVGLAKWDRFECPVAERLRNTADW